MNLGFIPEFSIQFRMYFHPQNLESEINLIHLILILWLPEDKISV